jgi:copper resistance protein D
MTLRPEAAVDDPLIWWRTIHFVATAMLGGVVIFAAYVAEPAFAAAGKDARLAVVIRRRLVVLAWVSLVLAVLSGAAWLVRLAQQISDGTLSAVLWDGIVWTVLTKTSFGTVWTTRLALAVLVGVSLSFRFSPSTLTSRTIVLFATATLVASLAFAGHAAAGTGIDGLLHLGADIVHLLAAAAWVGALVPLAMLLHAASTDPAALAIARVATRRFSTLGVWSVGALVVTGVINTWMLAGSVAALTETDYGRLLLAKVALFGFMVAIAAANRLRLTPRLLQERDGAGASAALRALRRNCMAEAAVGALVLIIVAALGTLPPGAHEEGLHQVAEPALAAL